MVAPTTVARAQAAWAEALALAEAAELVAMQAAQAELVALAVVAEGHDFDGRSG